MPRRDDIRTILILGSGPIVIGQGCEFDYSGAQACKSLRDDGYRVVLVNSNPATIMTDPAMSDRTYIEPITPECVRKVLAKERDLGTPIDAILPTLGGQTALNCACALWDDGVLTEFGVEMIGADRKVIHRAEDRAAFNTICNEIGLATPESQTVNSLEEALEFLETIGTPAIVRPAFTLGGWGGGIAYNREEFAELVTRGLGASMINQVQVDRSLIGWKEFELEVVRDTHDNCVIVCGIENIDAMGVHTGDSVTVAPILTLTDKEYQAMRDAAIAVMRAVGVETGGSNVQFAVNPNPEPRGDGTKPFEMVVVEMNPRVSRSSALASKATGFPIAKIAAKLAVGYTLDELRNDITGTTSACFEPAIDYVVTKMPRWTFEKFPEADETLTTQMKSVGEAMAIGRTFKESLQKVIRSMDVKRFGLGLDRNDKWLPSRVASCVARRSAAEDTPNTSSADRAAVAEQLRDNPRSSLDPVGFVPRDPYPPGMYGPVRDLVATRRNLPHFELPDATYFVTWRLGEGDRLSDSERESVLSSLLHFDGDRCRVYAAVVMPDHVHWLVRPFAGHDLAGLVTSVKHFSAVEINRERGITGHLWQDERFDHIIRDAESFNETVGYILTNPVEAELVGHPESYRWSFVHADAIGTSPAAERRATQDWPIDENKLTRKLSVPSQGRLYYVRYAFKMGWSVERVHELSGIDPFFLDQILELVEFEDELCAYDNLNDVPEETLFRAKQLGYSDAQLANLYLGAIKSETILEVRARRKALGIEPVFKLVDTCAAEFEAVTPYYYSTYERVFNLASDSSESCPTTDDEIRVSDTPKVIILGGGPNRIGQGIEFDYCCTHAAFAARELGFESVMINSNPETVSTDYDTSDLLFFEPLTLEDVLNVVERLNGDGSLVNGVVVQFGGQTPLNLAHGLALAGAPLIGTSLDSIDLAEDRDRFDDLLERMGLRRPASGIARSLDEAAEIAGRIGYPVLVRPSYVLGGRGMEICSDDASLRHYMTNAVDISDLDDAPILIDKFLDGATEVDVDVVADFAPTTPTSSDPNEPRAQARGADRSGRALVCGVMEHIEQAGVHSGDSGCVTPPYSLARPIVERIRAIARSMAKELRINGLMNIQLAVRDGEVSIIEVNPRASRTVPFVAKAKHVPWPAIAAKVMMGKSLDELGAEEVRDTGSIAVKESVFPFQKFPGVDVVLGPEMRSTGEVMGIDVSMPTAYLKGLLSAGTALPRDGGVFISVNEHDKPDIVGVARSLLAMGYTVYTSPGTGAALERHGMRPKVLAKIGAGARPNVLDLMSNDEISLIINTPTRAGWQTDEGRIRATAVRLGIPMITTLTGAQASIGAIQSLRAGDWGVAALQDFAPHCSPRETEAVS